jgi:hypothetical protein
MMIDMIVSAPQKRRRHRAVLGLIFGLYCAALRPAAAAMSAAIEVGETPAQSASISSPRRAVAASVRAAEASSDRDARLGVRFVRRHHRRSHAAAVLLETVLVVPSSAPSRAPVSAFPVSRDAGGPEYPPSVLS